jgi:CRP-like cAMP-binding protein
MRKVLFLFGQLSDADIAWMARIGERRRMRAEEVLILEGHRSDWIYIVLDGKVAVTIAGIGEVAMLGAGEIFGEMSFVDAMLPSATVSAASDLVLLAVPQRDFRDRIDGDPAFGCRFYRALAMFLSDRLRAATRRTPATAPSAPEAAKGGELDEFVLDGVSQAGERFDRLVRNLLGAEAR